MEGGSGPAVLIVLWLLGFVFSAVQPAAAQGLPARLSDAEFWKMISDFSEPNGFFSSDNYVSNETSYQRVIPAIRPSIVQKGAYIGVGPEQNFTYIAALQPQMAFIIDIRRQNQIGRAHV